MVHPCTAKSSDRMLCIHGGKSVNCGHILTVSEIWPQNGLSDNAINQKQLRNLENNIVKLPISYTYILWMEQFAYDLSTEESIGLYLSVGCIIDIARD